MHADFWHNLWERNEIGFHLEEANPLLVSFFSELNLEKESRIFLPLCGKSVDIPWLLDQGYDVVGIELNEGAIKELFECLGVNPKVEQLEQHLHYSAEGIDIFVGDIFKLSREIIGRIDAIYDRGALVALPLNMREEYTPLLRSISSGVPQLVINFEYDQKLMQGPPFSISDEELLLHYKEYYKITLLQSNKLTQGPFAPIGASEKVWLLH